MLNLAATYYETCMNTKQIGLVGDEPMKALVEKLGKQTISLLKLVSTCPFDYGIGRGGSRRYAKQLRRRAKQ